MTRTALKPSKLNRTITVDEALANPRILKALVKECFSCDPYNPTHVERANCPECKGSGVTPFEFVGIVNEMRKDRRAKEKRTESYYDED